MKSLALMILTTWIGTALAVPQRPAPKPELITCQFTEPFFTLTYDITNRTMIKTEPNWETGTGTISTNVGTRLSYRKLSDQAAGPLAHFSRYGVYKKGKQILVLTLNYQGSDGMSDLIFPYHAELKGELLGGSTANMGIGGCETETMEAIGLEQQSE